jgi:hypothetical protein
VVMPRHVQPLIRHAVSALGSRQQEYDLYLAVVRRISAEVREGDSNNDLRKDQETDITMRSPARFRDTSAR